MVRSGGEDLTVGTMLSGCDYAVSKGYAASIDAKAPCDVVVRYVVNYCLSHMNDTIAIDNKQVCWDNAMESGLEYAVKWLDGGTGNMLKAQSDIMATKSNAAALPSRCDKLIQKVSITEL